MNACETGRMKLSVKIALNAQLKRKKGYMSTNPFTICEVCLKK